MVCSSSSHLLSGFPHPSCRMMLLLCLHPSSVLFCRFFICAHKTVPVLACFPPSLRTTPLRHETVPIRVNHSRSSSFSSYSYCWDPEPWHVLISCPSRLGLHASKNTSHHLISLFGLSLVKDFLLVPPNALQHQPFHIFSSSFSKPLSRHPDFDFVRNYSKFNPLLTRFLELMISQWLLSQPCRASTISLFQLHATT